MSTISLVPALNCAGRILTLDRPRIMGILNITPDSFSDGGALYNGAELSLDKVLHRVETMVAEGADIVDIGGESTRPGAAPVSAQQELDRVIPVVQRLMQEFDIVLSIDTSEPQVMLEAASSGAGFINDVRALQRPGAIRAAAATGVPICLMHMQGEPKSMQAQPVYNDVVEEVSAFFRHRIGACTTLGVAHRNLVLDPGFGFGKTVQHNLQLLNRLDQLCNLGHPVLVGLSRKSLIGKVVGRSVNERLAGSIALATIAAMRGAVIFRVHDVAETRDAVRLCTAVIKEQFE